MINDGRHKLTPAGVPIYRNTRVIEGPLDGKRVDEGSECIGSASVYPEDIRLILLIFKPRYQFNLIIIDCIVAAFLPSFLVYPSYLNG